MTDDHILFHVEDGIAHLTLNRPTKHNAITAAMGGEIARLSRRINTDPDIMGGVPVFVGTRVPVQSLFDYIEGGETLDEFLHQFPSVTRERAITALDAARDTLLTGARTS